MFVCLHTEPTFSYPGKMIKKYERSYTTVVAINLLNNFTKNGNKHYYLKNLCTEIVISEPNY